MNDMPRLPANRLYVGAGTNLGDRIQNLINARQLLTEMPRTRVLDSSSMYISSPVGYLDQPNFINCVFRLELDNDKNQQLAAESILCELQKIESALGRIRDPNNQNAARKIDLDILAYDNLQCSQANLTIPHPRICQRLFVILPLLELEPDLFLPGIGRLEELLKIGRTKGCFDDQQIYKLGE